jgi:predicted dehydrogenase
MQRNIKMSDKVKVGVIGCGAISNAYFKGMKAFGILEPVACADINMEAAKAKAEEYEIKAVTVDELLADPEIEIVLNLTIPAAHAEVSLKILEAGKHVHCEKPLAVNREDGKKVIETAKAKGLMVGCAPDTFLGAGHQTSRKLIEDGWVGKPIAGTAFMMGHGPEGWHPNPGFYYLQGGGPMFDMGPYYLTALVNMLGPVKKVSAITSKAFKERKATCKEHFGEMLPVKVPTHYAGTLEFACGAVITVVMSFDVWRHTNHNIEIHGTEGSLQVPDPNGFGGSVKVFRPESQEWKEVGFSHGYSENMRGIGVADMAYAIKSGRKNRCNGDLAYHVLDVMTCFEEASNAGACVEVSSSCDQPTALPLGLVHGLLDD